MLDLLGGEVEEGESPEEAATREMAEELLDIRSNSPYVLKGHKSFLVYSDERGCEQHIFTSLIDLEISDLRLLEGKELEWFTEDELNAGTKLAFGCENVLKLFFESRK